MSISIQKVSAEAPDFGDYVPFQYLFYNLGNNILGTLGYNYGLNVAGMGGVTAALISSGFDWKWNRMAWNNSTITKLGTPFIYTGYYVPVAADAIIYAGGLIAKNSGAQITAMALTQAHMITGLLQETIKMTSGRATPGLVNAMDQRRSNRTSNFSAVFNPMDMNGLGGWPSGHTANAFAAAAVIACLYPHNYWFQVGMWTYASLTALGLSVSGHWASDCLAGMLLGIGSGYTVGRSYRNLLDGKPETPYGGYNLSTFLPSVCIIAGAGLLVLGGYFWPEPKIPTLPSAAPSDAPLKPQVSVNFTGLELDVEIKG
jgi:membrane-associated phospholipid phosphatase